MRCDSALEQREDTERSSALGILCQGEKEGKVLSTHRAYVQQMNFCSWKSNTYEHTRQTQHPPSKLCSFLPGLHRDAVMQWGCPFCKGEQGLLFPSKHWWVCSGPFMSFYMVTPKSKGILCEQQTNFELLSVYLEHRKGYLIGLLPLNLPCSNQQHSRAPGQQLQAQSQVLNSCIQIY